VIILIGDKERAHTHSGVARPRADVVRTAPYE